MRGTRKKGETMSFDRNDGWIDPEKRVANLTDDVGDLWEDPSNPPESIRRLEQEEGNLARALSELEEREVKSAFKEMEKAENELLMADNKLAKGHKNMAVDHCRQAWKHALKAIESAEGSWFGNPTDVTDHIDALVNLSKKKA
jgi:hypothetical protein